MDPIILGPVFCSPAPSGFLVLPGAPPGGPKTKKIPGGFFLSDSFHGAYYFGIIFLLSCSLRLFGASRWLSKNQKIPGGFLFSESFHGAYYFGTSFLLSGSLWIFGASRGSAGRPNNPKNTMWFFPQRFISWILDMFSALRLPPAFWCFPGLHRAAKKPKKYRVDFSLAIPFMEPIVLGSFFCSPAPSGFLLLPGAPPGGPKNNKTPGGFCFSDSFHGSYYFGTSCLLSGSLRLFGASRGSAGRPKNQKNTVWIFP